MKPLLSIIVPTLNEERFLSKLLDSLAAQSEQNFEVIIADGNSEDKTVEIAKKYKKKLSHLTIIQSPKRGVAVQRNVGSAAAQGSWIVTTDADSIFHPYATAQIARYIAEKKSKHFCCWFSTEMDNPNDALLILLINVGIEFSVKMKHPAAYGAFMVTDKKIFKEIGGFNEALEFGEDNDLCRRIHEETGEMMGIMREAAVTYSLRRIHTLGIAQTLQLYARASFVLLVTKRTPAKLPGYVMGGHVYTEKQKREWSSLLKNYEKTIKEFMSEFMK